MIQGSFSGQEGFYQAKTGFRPLTWTRTNVPGAEVTAQKHAAAFDLWIKDRESTPRRRSDRSVRTLRS